MLPGMCCALAGVGSGLRFLSHAASTTAGSATALSIPKPSGVISGDLLVAVMSANTNDTWTGDAGWTERVDQNASPALRVATLVAGGAEPASYTFTHLSSAPVVGQILAFRGAAYDAIGAIVTLTGNGALAISQITSAGGVLIAAVGSESQAARTHTTPTGMTLTEQKFNGDSSISAFYQDVSSGATGTRTSTTAGGTGENAGVLVGVKGS